MRKLSTLLLLLGGILISAAFAESTNSYDALLWYRNSIERVALYHQIFSSASDQITSTVEEQKLKPQSWGVVFGLDGTLLDDSAYHLAKIQRGLNENNETRNNYLASASLPATPGASEISCEIQKQGGVVFIVTNRNGSAEAGLNLRDATIRNLQQQKICFNSILFANDHYDSNKNPRFTAITSGDYENIIASKIYPEKTILAYFGSDIQDFPNYKQSSAASVIAQESEPFAKFGSEYFLLPKPIAGSWQNNRLK